MTTILSIPMNEGIDVHLQTSSQDPLVNVSPAVVRSRGALPLAHGMEPGDPSWSFEQVEDVLYSVNGRTRMQAYDGDAVTRASLAPPVGDLRVEAERIAIRVQDQGWVSKFNANLSIVGVNLRLSNIAAVYPTNWVPSDAMLGKLIVIPSNQYFGAGGVDGADVIGRVVDVISETQIDIETDGPAFTANQETGEVLVRCFYYDAEEVGDLDKSTTYTDFRPVPHGGDEPTDGFDQDGIVNPQALEFHGSHALRVEQDLPQGVVIEAETVFEFKCYFRPTRLSTGLDERQIIFQRRGDEKSAALELSIVENGKVEFRFWDRSIEDFRSIRTVGICFTEGHWHYLRFRYKFKRGGMKACDTTGGWETDHRWIHRSANGKDKKNRYRDGLWVWDLESAGYELNAQGVVLAHECNEPFLVVPGCHNGFNLQLGAGNEWVNRSLMLGNVGLVKENPWIGPEETDQRYVWGIGGTPNIVAYQANITPLAPGAGTDGNTEFTCQMVTQLWLPRWFSLNRDIGVTDDPGDKHINQADANSYYHTPATPALSLNLGTGVLRNRAVLCYVFGVAGGARYDPPRILAVRDLYGASGGNEVDIGVVDQDSEPDAEFTLTDDPLLGADGLGPLAGGEEGYIIGFCLPNGSNHAVQATGNTTPIPTLLVQGEHPVGVNDDPDPEEAPFYLGGTPNQEDEAHAINGLFGVLDDVAFSFYEVTGSDAYTEDHMLPDTKFTGPIESRVHSLPRLNIDNATTSTNGEDLTALTVSLPIWSSYLDAALSGKLIEQENGDNNGELVLLDTKVQSKGKHNVLVTFYDPERGVESPPSKLGVVEISAENDPSQSPQVDLRYDAAYKIRLELPISADTRRYVWRRIYKTLADGASFFRAAEVRDNRSRTLDLNPTDTYLALQEQVDLSYLEPPICSVIKANEQRMFFAGIKDAVRELLGSDYVDTPRLVAWSQAFAPWQVPGTSREVLESGRGNRVTGLAYITGRMFALYPDALFVADDLASTIRWRRVQANVGTLSHLGLAELEDYLALPSEKGIYGLDASSRMLYLSPEVEETWRGLHAPAMAYVHGVYNRQRNQYQVSAREQLDGEYQLLITGEISDSPFAGAQDGLATAPGAMRPIWSKQIHPVGLEALHASDDPWTGKRVVILGSGMGFAMLMDVDSGVRGHEDNTTLYGDIRGAIDSVINPGVWQLKDLASVDIEHHGLAGIPWILTRPDPNIPGLETYVGQGVVFELGEDLILRVLRRSAAPTPQEDDLIYLGGWRCMWTSKWFGAERLVKRERDYALELIFDINTDGYMLVEFFHDFATVASKTYAVPMDKGYAYVPIDIRGHYLQFRISRMGINPTLNIFGIGIRHRMATQRQ